MDFIKAPRGLRNNNPGNIRKGTEWKGETQGHDPAFETFTSVEYGIRAIFKLIDTYIKKYNLETVQGIIARYAPAFENQTANYINSVVRYMVEHANEDQLVYLNANMNMSKVTALGLLPLFVGGIIEHENGMQPFNFQFIAECQKL
jgi:hypothetical protein